jgi:hypothetical protein
VKQNSNELFDLIRNLSLSEKRYCSLYLKKHGTGADNRYVKLFNFLKAQEEYDTKAAQKKAGFEQKPSHYAVLKKQLYEQLLDALHQFDLFSNSEQQLLRGIHQCHLLLQKGLFKQCDKRTESLLKVAQKMDHYEAQLQLQQLKMTMKARMYYRHVSEGDLKKWDDETRQIIDELQVTNHYRYLGSLIYKMQYDAGVRGKELAEKMKAIVQKPEFSNEKNAKTTSAYLDFLQVRALYHFTNLETDKAAVYNEKFLKLLDDNPLLMKLNADRYFSVLNNYLIDCLVLKRYPTLENGLEKMRGLSKIEAFKRLVNFDANVFRLGYLLEMNYMITTGRFSEAYKNLKAISEGLSKFGDRIVKHNRITLQYLKAYVCFALGQYEESLDYLRPILQEKETSVAENVQMAARMLQLLCHFEMHDYILLDSLIKSVRRLLGKNPAAEMQMTVISFIANAIKATSIETTKWQDVRKKINELATNRTTAGSLNLFNYIAWVSAHVSKIKMAEAWET